MKILWHFVYTCYGFQMHVMREEAQPLKTLAQYAPFKEVAKCFRRTEMTDWDVFKEANKHATYQYKDGKNLVSNVYIAHEIFTDKAGLEKKDVLCLYSVYTGDNYRKKGYARELLKLAINEYINNKNLDNPMIALHINPKDAMMNFNYAFYYSLGFTKGAIVESGACTYQFRYDDIAKMQDVRDVYKNIDKNDDKGTYIAMFCPYNELFPKQQIIMKEMIAEGELLREKLVNRETEENKEYC